MKQIETTQTGKNYSAVSVGKLNEIIEHELPMGPNVTIKRKVFLCQAVGATGTDAASGANYTVTDTAKKTVAYTGSTKNGKSVTIPTTVTIASDTFTVTEIKANAIGAKATKVTINAKSITKVNKKAFAKAKKLTKVVVKGTTKKTSVGKQITKAAKKAKSKKAKVTFKK